LPEDKEAEPFAEIVSAQPIAQDRLPPESAAALEKLSDPAELLVFVASSCPHCPDAVRAARAIAFASCGVMVTVTIVDAQRFEELAARHHVLSAPTTVLDGELCRSGVIPAEELALWILERGSAQHDFRVLRSQLESGRLDEATEAIVSGSATPHFVALWEESATSTRIGLMLLAEKALARSPEALTPGVPQLIALLSSTDSAMRGDTADLLGQIDDPSAHPALRELLDDPDPDVAEIAAEALGLD
jgi:glutaredoxin